MNFIIYRTVCSIGLFPGSWNRRPGGYFSHALFPLVFLFLSQVCALALLAKFQLNFLVFLLYAK